MSKMWPMNKLFKGRGKDNKNTELAKVIDLVAYGDSPQARQALYEVFVRSKLIVPISGELTARQPAIIEDSEGHPILPTFTDMDAFSAALRKWKPGNSNNALFDGANLFSFVLSNSLYGLVINPASSVGVEITRREMTIVAEHGTVIERGEGFSTPIVIAQNANRQVRAASKEPSVQFITSLREGMKRHSLISAGYLGEILWGEGTPHPIVGIRFTHMPDEHSIREVVEDLSKAVHPVLADNEYVDFVILQNDETSHNLQESGLLIYQST
jgi:SseB protein N-terminal domain/SseB protein C-terminal domain